MNELRIKNKQRNDEWNNQEDPVSLSFRGVELAGEVGELCNLIKKLERGRFKIAGSNTDLDAIKEELADVIICTDLIAMDLGIDLNKAIKKKFNNTSDKYNLKTKF